MSDYELSIIAIALIVIGFAAARLAWQKWHGTEWSGGPEIVDHGRPPRRWYRVRLLRPGDEHHEPVYEYTPIEEVCTKEEIEEQQRTGRWL